MYKVPMLEILAHYIIQFIQNTSYFGIFILMALESALIPIPSEITMPFSGFLASTSSLSFWGVVITGSIANLAGSLIAYYIGYILGETVIARLIRNYGKFILVTMDDYDKALKWFSKYADKVVFVSRLLPAVRTVISLPAGVFKMDLKKFIIYTIAGSFIWSTFLTYIGFLLGENWNILGDYFRKFELVLTTVILVFVVLYVIKKLKSR